MIDEVHEVEALYDWRHQLGGTTKDYQRIAEADVHLLSEHIEIKKSKICDVGCGDGAHLNALVYAGAIFPLGIDLSGQALLSALASESASRVLILKGDITLWRPINRFDAVICSLPPIAHDGRMCVRSLTSTLSAIIRPKGFLMLKLFTLESVQSITGTYAVQYDLAKATLHSSISIADQGRSLRIEQNYGHVPNEKRIEQIALPTYSEVSAALIENGFLLDHSPAQNNNVLPGVVSFHARLS